MAGNGEDGMIPVVDSHHHIWRQDDLPWLKGPMVPRIFGPYESIRRDYPIDEYLSDIAGCGVEKSVYVQTNWLKTQAVDEARYVQAVSDACGFPHAIVAYTNLLSEDAPRVLSELAKFPAMRGIRMQLHWHENPLYRFAESPDLMNAPLFRKNFARLAAHDLSFDLQVFAPQMADAAKLAADFPGTTFILQHAGMLEDLSHEGRRAWREGMKRLAGEPNVVTKLSGLGTFTHRNDAGHIRDVVGQTTDIFGVDRCLFGSNFPIEKIWTSYTRLIDAFRGSVSDFGDGAALAMLRDNAKRIYRLQ
jgi:predicted TIM-barrel fold metal-dependent hydrolase